MDFVFRATSSRSIGVLLIDGRGSCWLSGVLSRTLTKSTEENSLLNLSSLGPSVDLDDSPLDFKMNFSRELPG